MLTDESGQFLAIDFDNDTRSLTDIMAVGGKIVETRSRIGDWELDAIIGKGHKQALVSLAERKTRLTLLAKVQHKSAQLVSW